MMNRWLAGVFVLASAGVVWARPAAYVTVNPTPTHVAEAVTIAGCGYGSRPKDIYVQIEGPSGDYMAFATHTEGESGCFTSAEVPVSFPEAGWYAVYVFPDRAAGDGKGTYQFNHAAVDFDFQVVP